MVKRKRREYENQLEDRFSFRISINDIGEEKETRDFFEAMYQKRNLSEYLKQIIIENVKLEQTGILDGYYQLISYMVYQKLSYADVLKKLRMEKDDININKLVEIVAHRLGVAANIKQPIIDTFVKPEEEDLFEPLDME